MTRYTAYGLASSWQPRHIAELLEITPISADGRTYSIHFDDLEFALAAIEKAKQQDWAEYLRGGGNPRNKRSHGAQYAAIAKAVRRAAQ